MHAVLQQCTNSSYLSLPDTTASTLHRPKLLPLRFDNN